MSTGLSSSMGVPVTMLPEPTSVHSMNGILQTSIHLVKTTHTIEATYENELTGMNRTLELITRSLNGTIPGPTLYVNPGDQLLIEFFNDLHLDLGLESLGELASVEPHIHNELSSPNESNLHFHGLYISSELPSDDSLLVVKPGESFVYNTTIPSDHLPGVHWIHPHRHGSTALQVGGGCAMTIIVQDAKEESELPSEILAAPEHVIMIQEMKNQEWLDIARDSGSKLFDESATLKVNDGGDDTASTRNSNNGRPKFDLYSDQIFLANGQINPTLAIKANTWIRLRIAYAGWLEGKLVMDIVSSSGSTSATECDVQLVAKDGIYLSTLPRQINKMEISNAGRADIMISCRFDTTTTSGDSSYQMRYNTGRDKIQPILTLVKDETSSSAVVTSPPGSIPQTSITFPNYLQDLRNVEVTDGCSCFTETDDIVFPKDSENYLHESYLGSIVERHLETQEHPYHQHVYPFQLIDGVPTSNRNPNAYNQIGDWHDTINGEVTIRYSPTVFTGKIMVHCHTLKHEDEGMMAIEYVHPRDDNVTCSCGEMRGGGRGRNGGFELDDMPIYAIVLIAIVILSILIIPIGCWYRRQPR